MIALGAPLIVMHHDPLADLGFGLGSTSRGPIGGDDATEVHDRRWWGSGWVAGPWHSDRLAAFGRRCWCRSEPHMPDAFISTTTSRARPGPGVGSGKVMISRSRFAHRKHDALHGSPPFRCSGLDCAMVRARLTNAPLRRTDQGKGGRLAMAITFTPLHPVIGAECAGIDISQPL